MLVRGCVQREYIFGGTMSESVHSAGAAMARALSKDSAFASLRFDGVVPAEAAKLQAALAQRGVSLEIINMVGGGDIDQAVIDGIEHCDTFIVFGSEKYGENTGNAVRATRHFSHRYSSAAARVMC